VKVMLFALVVASACCTNSKPTPTAAPSSVDSGIATVETVCANYRALGCPAGKSTPQGATCETVLSNAIASGMVRINLACRASASSCPAADACESPR
jgi:hypothetical protein